MTNGNLKVEEDEYVEKDGKQRRCRRRDRCTPRHTARRDRRKRKRSIRKGIKLRRWGGGDSELKQQFTAAFRRPLRCIYNRVTYTGSPCTGAHVSPPSEYVTPPNRINLGWCAAAGVYWCLAVPAGRSVATGLRRVRLGRRETRVGGEKEGDERVACTVSNLTETSRAGGRERHFENF